jgi:hypothetical protein
LPPLNCTQPLTHISNTKTPCKLTVSTATSDTMQEQWQLGCFHWHPSGNRLWSLHNATTCLYKPSHQSDCHADWFSLQLLTADASPRQLTLTLTLSLSLLQHTTPKLLLLRPPGRMPGDSHHGMMPLNFLTAAAPAVLTASSPLPQPPVPLSCGCCCCPWCPL